MLAKIPVCIVTGAVDFRALMYHRNVPPPDGYVQKPIKSDVLMMTVRKLLEMKQRHESPTEESATAAAP